MRGESKPAEAIWPAFGIEFSFRLLDKMRLALSADRNLHLVTGTLAGGTVPYL